MKKYRPKKIWVVLSVLFIIFFIAEFVIDSWQRYAAMIGCIAALVGLFITLKYWFEITEDKIVIRQWVQSSNKAYESHFKIKTIMIADINNLDVCNKGTVIAINLKNGDEIYFSISGYYNRSSIIAQVYEVKKKVYKMKKQLY